MKTRILVLIAIICLITGGFLFSEEEIPIYDDSPVHLLSPQIEAMGGSYVPIASGFESLFTNPAGLSRRGGQLTFLSVNLGPYFAPSMETIELLANALNNGDEVDPMDLLMELLGELDLKSGFGTNMNVGLGLAAGGIGVGFLTDVDMLITQEGTALSLFVDPLITSSLVGGLSHGFRLGGTKLHVGADARAIARIRPSERLSVTEILDIATAQTEFDPNAYNFALSLGYGFDAGAIFEMGGGFTVGASVKNIGGTTMITSNQTMAQLETAFNDANGPTGVLDYLTTENLVDGYAYVIPMSVTAGVGYDTPSKEMMDLKVTAEYTHTFWADEENIENDSIWKNINLGAELNFLRLLKVRGGINQGYFTFGGGLNLLVLEVNAAYYSREMGSYAGQNQNQALVVGAKVKL